MQARPHQAQAIDFAIESLKAQRARCLVQLPTGSGKSLIKAHLARYWNSLGRKVVILTPSNVTVGSLFWWLRRAGLKPEIEMAEKKAPRDSETILSTYATAWRHPFKHREPGALLILDECHHCNEKATSNLSIYSQFDYVFGVSASPWNATCLRLFERHHYYPLRQSIKDGVNCNFEILEDQPIGTGKHQIVYCMTSTTAKQASRLVPSGDWVFYDTGDRNNKIIEFTKGNISTMFVNKMLTEGFDCPGVKQVWIQRTTRSTIMAYQMLGRALRPHNNQTAKCYVANPKTRRILDEALKLAGY